MVPGVSTVTLRVCLATYDDDPPLGGQGVLVRGMRASLQRRGVDVRTVAGRGAHAVPIPRRTGRPPLDLSLLLNRHPQALLDGDTCLVHAMGGPGGVLLVRRLDVPVVYTANHTYRQAYGRGSPRRALSVAERVAYRRAAAVLCISASTASAVRALGVAAERVEVVLPGVDVDRIARAAAAVPREAGRLLFVGRLEAEKGALDAVAVMTALAARDPGVRGVVVGEGAQLDRVRAAAAAAGSGRITVLGPVGEARLLDEYGRASIVLVPSAYEGLGLVALEALGAGAAVCGYDVTGLRDAVGDAGMLVPRGSVAALTAAAASLLADPQRRAELAEAGAERVRREHSWDPAAARIEAVYRRVLSTG
jgi:glycosyltransferase involved in cell wall biosynthesis